MSLISRNGINEIVQLLPMKIQNLIVKMPQEQKNSIKELRLRSEKPVVIVSEKGSAFLSESGKLSYIISDSLPIVSADELSEVVKRICGYSVYSHLNEIINGFITIRGGHRVGMCGTAVIENGKVSSVKDINSINIRIANQYIGCANELMSKIFYNGLSNVIIAGPPMSGKTTVLRDLIRQISDGNSGEYYKCSVIDERCEIAAVNASIYENNVGQNTDVLSNYPKGQGISQAVRTLSPDIVFCDETATENEVDEIINGILCGVHFVLTVHSLNENQLIKRSVTKRLLNNDLIDYIVFLGTGYNIGKIEKIIKVGDYSDENDRYSNLNDNLHFCG